MSRIAIVHERWTEIGGSENVIEQLALEWPDARVHVPFADPAAIGDRLRGRIETSRLDRLHGAIGRRSHAPLLPLVPRALRAMDFGDVDAAIISHHAMAASAVHALDVPTVGYVHSPARWAWEPEMRAGEATNPLARVALSALARQAIRVESSAAPEFTRIVANSNEVADRIRRWWGRESTVVFPPVNVDRFRPGDPADRGDYFLMAGRLVPYKRADLAVRAAREAGVRLIVAGDGRLEELCRRLAGPETTFVGRVPHAELVDLAQRARAMLMPGVEDFGIMPVEVMACGTPVVALGSGGALDTVVPGVTGLLVQPGDDDRVVTGFAAAMRDFPDRDFDPAVLRAHAETFSDARFRRRMREVVDAL